MSAIEDMPDLALPDVQAAAQELTFILELQHVGLSVTGGRIVGHGTRASVDIRLSDGSFIVFEKFGDVTNPTKLGDEVTCTTGATPTLKKTDARRAAALIRQLSEHVQVVDEDHLAREWGCDFLQAADVLDLDMNDQAARWAAFQRLLLKDPVMERQIGSAASIADASLVLRHTDGTRFVRTGWFKAHVKAEDAISGVDLAARMERIGWSRRGGTRRDYRGQPKGAAGRIKATRPGHGDTLVWTFWTVPDGWESTTTTHHREHDA